MWGWITAILKALLPFLWDKAEQPSTLTDEKVPKTLKSALDADVSDKLRNKQSSNPTEWNPPSGS